MTSQQQNIQITGIGLSCASGNMPFAMYGAVASNMSFSKPDSNVQVPSVDDEDSFEYVMSCPMDLLTGCEDPNQRMLVNTTIALTQAFDSLNLDDSYSMELDDQSLEKNNSEKIIVYIILPDLTDGRGENLNLEQWRESLLGEDSPLEEYVDVSTIDIKFGNYTQGVTQQLVQICDYLHKNNSKTVIFGGVDSLLDEFTSFQLSQKQRVQTEQTQGGIVTGEGAAFLVLKAVADIPEKNNTSALAYIKSLSHKEEPNAGKRAMVNYTGQGAAINDVVSQSNISLEQIDTMIVSPGMEQQSLIEYHQVISKLYPNKLPEQQRMAMQLGEIEAPKLEPRKYPEKLDLSFTYGFVGAASIPMSIILACARFEFKSPAITNCIVCEANEYSHRGAVLISNTL